MAKANGQDVRPEARTPPDVMASPSQQTASEEVAEALASPLVAHADKAGGDAAATARRESLRAKRERRRRQRQRDKHIAEFDGALSLNGTAGSRGSATSSQTSAARKKKQKGTEDARSSGRRRRRGDWGARLVTAVHVLDALLGVAALAYGALLLTGFDAPATEAAVAILIYGSAVACSSVAGTGQAYLSSPSTQPVELMMPGSRRCNNQPIRWCPRDGVRGLPSSCPLVEH